MEQEALYPFGYGLTYTDFKLTSHSLSGDTLRCTVKNTGAADCIETLQLYVSFPKTDCKNPIRALRKTERADLKAGEEKEFVFCLQDSDFYSVNENGDTVYLEGEYPLYLFDGQNISVNAGTVVNPKATSVIEKCPI